MYSDEESTAKSTAAPHRRKGHASRECHTRARKTAQNLAPRENSTNAEFRESSPTGR